MEIISIINQKGGVGKSTTAHTLGQGLKIRGFRVLFIDLDPQGNLSYTMNSAYPTSSLQLLTCETTPLQTVEILPQGDLIPSSPSLAGADMIITTTGKEYRLKESLANIVNNYDFIIIDTPPALGILTINALTASHSLIIPAQADIYSLQGISQLYSTIETVKKYCNPQLYIRGILLTRYNARAVISRDIRDMIESTAQNLSTSLFRAQIRECTAVKEAQAMKKSIFDYAPKSNAAIDYTDLLNEILPNHK